MQFSKFMLKEILPGLTGVATTIITAVSLVETKKRGIENAAIIRDLAKERGKNEEFRSHVEKQLARMDMQLSHLTELIVNETERLDVSRSV
jgi:hypothetical protein